MLLGEPRVVLVANALTHAAFGRDLSWPLGLPLLRNTRIDFRLQRLPRSGVVNCQRPRFAGRTYARSRSGR